MSTKTLAERTPLEATQFLLNTTNTLKDIHKTFRLSQSTIDPKIRRSTAVDTGMLMSNLLLAGGVYPGGWYTFFGPEQSCKSTHVMQILGMVFENNVPTVVHWDFEGSTDPGYMEQMFGDRLNVQRLFGVPDPNKAGEWVVEPRIDYQAADIGEVFYKAMGKLLKSLPDKFYTDDEWWLAFDNSKENISRFSEENCKKLGIEKNKKLSSDMNKIVIKSLDGGTMQALILLDSYPAMVSEADDDDDGNNALGIEARMHSKYIKRVKSRLKKKHCTVIGVNQLRLRPMAMGNPEYESGGEALKFFSDARVKQTPRSIPHGKGMLEEEDGVNGGTDTYRYIHMRAIKNKMGTPFLEAWYRLWVSDSQGKGRGFDPIYDTYQYLVRTGQAKGSSKEENIVNAISINMVNRKGASVFSIEKLKWHDFKKLVGLKGKDLKDFCNKLGLEKPVNLREMCFKQLKSGFGTELFFSHLNKTELFSEKDVEFDLDVLGEKEYKEFSVEQLQFWIESYGYEIKGYKKKDKKTLIKALKKIDEASEAEEDE